MNGITAKCKAKIPGNAKINFKVTFTKFNASFTNGQPFNGIVDSCELVGSTYDYIRDGNFLSASVVLFSLGQPLTDKEFSLSSSTSWTMTLGTGHWMQKCIGISVINLDYVYDLICTSVIEYINGEEFVYSIVYE